MKTAILASEHYFTQQDEAKSSLWFNLDEVIKTETGYQEWLDVQVPAFLEQGITRVFGLTDLTALVAAHCEFLMGCRSHKSFLSIVQCLDKPHVRSVIGDTAYNVNVITHLPAFVKPIHSSLSQGSGFILNKEEYKEHIAKHADVVYETTEKYRIFGEVSKLDLFKKFHEFYGEECILPGTQITADVLSHNGEITVLSVSESVFHEGIPSFSYFNFPYDCPSETMTQVQEAATEITHRLHLDDLLFNIEFIVTNDGDLKLIEVNPRPATQFIPAIKAVRGFDGWHYLESGEVNFIPPSTQNLAIKIFRTLSDSKILNVPEKEQLDELMSKLKGTYNSFADKCSVLSDYQQDGYTYRIGESYLPYSNSDDREKIFKEALNILESNAPLIDSGEVI